MSFDSLGLSAPLLKAISELGYETPSPIQAKAIPEIIAGKDVMAAAQTGTGKTAGFTLPLLERLAESGNKVKGNHIRALILTPTRELAAQVQQSVYQYSKHIGIHSQSVYGGVKINPQMMKLRRGVDVLVATPGRLLDLHQQRAVNFGQVEMFVLDEADRMLDMGFIGDIRKIMRLMPKDRQNLLFSATFSDEINDLAETIVNDPVRISFAAKNTTAETVKQWLCPVDKKKKPELLMHMITENEWEQVLVFSNTKHNANRLADYLNDWGIKSTTIHGNKSQGARTKALQDFKSKRARVLVATDIAARGIDIDLLPNVVNFDLPKVAEDYVHRIGRTGRAGADGQAVSLVSQDEFQNLNRIEQLIQMHIEREYIEGFDPRADLPAPRPLRKPRPKKPKKPRSDDSSERSSSGRGSSGRGSSGRNSSSRGSSGRGSSSRGSSSTGRSHSGNSSDDNRSSNDNDNSSRRNKPSASKSGGKFKSSNKNKSNAEGSYSNSNSSNKGGNRPPSRKPRSGSKPKA